MILFPVAFVLLLHVFFWGAGLATLAMPARWSRFWPVLIFPAGFALQSLVVWLAMRAGISFTDRVAWTAELIPLGLLAAAVWRRRPAGWAADIARFGLVWAGVAVVLGLLLLPLAIASFTDAAAQGRAAGGHRVYVEAARLLMADVSVSEVRAVVLRLDSFTPAAVLALNDPVLWDARGELAAIVTAVVLASTLPVVFWISRALFGYSAIASLAVALVYGVSPIPWHSFAALAPAQLLAAQAVAVVTWSGVALSRSRNVNGVEFIGTLAIGQLLGLGAFSWIPVAALAPSATDAIVRAFRKKAWPRLGRWTAAMALPVVLCSLAFWPRSAGLLELLRSFKSVGTGPGVLPLGPEGWLGMVQGVALEPWWWGVRWLLAVATIGMLTWAFARSAAMGRRRVWLVASVLAPVLFAYGSLEMIALFSENAGNYQGFGLFVAFYALLLPALCWWITLPGATRLMDWFVVAAWSTVVIGFNLIACGMYVVSLAFG